MPGNRQPMLMQPWASDLHYWDQLRLQEAPVAAAHQVLAAAAAAGGAVAVDAAAVATAAAAAGGVAAEPAAAPAWLESAQLG